jgi:hypothetical protein
MEGPITYFASETDFIIQPLLWKNISWVDSKMLIYRVIEKYTNNATWQDLLEGLLHCYESCTLLKAQTLPFGVRFQHKSLHFAHIFATWKTQSQRSSLRSTRNSGKNILNLLFQLKCS